MAFALGIASSAPLSVSETLPMASAIALGLGWGLPLMAQSWAGYRGRPSRPFAPPRRWLVAMGLSLIGLVALGALVSWQVLAPALLLPPIHVLAMALLALITLGVVGRSMRDLTSTWREIVVGTVGGGSLALIAALITEALAGFLLIFGASFVAAMTPGGLEQALELAQHLRDPAWLADMDNLARLLLRPGVAITLSTLTVVIVPLIEEAFKALGAAAVAFWKRPEPARVFLWGVASGAGFAMAENLFNGAIGGTAGWAPMALTRLGATAVHCLTGGIVGWGWGSLWQTRRLLPLFGAYGAAVTIHSLWNAAATGSVLLSAQALLKPDQTGVVGAGMLVLVAILGVLSVACLTALPTLGRRLTDERKS